MADDNQGQSQVLQGLNILATNSPLMLQAINRIVAAITASFPRVTGTFTLAASATTTVADTNVAANSDIIPFPTNAAAGTLQGSAKSLYISARTPGVSFAVTTASGGAPAGTETFVYILVTPS